MIQKINKNEAAKIIGGGMCVLGPSCKNGGMKKIK